MSGAVKEISRCALRELTARRAFDFCKCLALKMQMEARVGIEPTHKGFADLSLTTWVPRLIQVALT